VALKKYRCGTSPVSKISDKEDAAAALWNSEELSVKNSVGEPIPEFCQPPEHGSKRPSSVDREDTGHVLPGQPAGPEATSKFKELEREFATLVIHAASQSGDGEGLAGGSSNKKVNWSCIGSDAGEVAMVRNSGVSVAQQLARKGVDLCEPCGLPSQRTPRNRCCFDSTADGAIFDCSHGKLTGKIN
jgi:hypothetical protein